MTTALEQAAKALRMAKADLRDKPYSLAYIDDALVRLTAEQASEREFELAKLSQGAELTAARVSPNREALARLKDEINHAWMTLGTIGGDHPKYEMRVQEIAKLIDTLFRRLSSPVGEWRPTHRHYKGGLYRETGRGRRESNMMPQVYYENEKGEKFDRPVEEFDGMVRENVEPSMGIYPAWQRRYAPLPTPPQEKPT